MHEIWPWPPLGRPFQTSNGAACCRCGRGPHHSAARRPWLLPLDGRSAVGHRLWLELRLPILEIVNPNNPRVLRWWYTWDKGQNMGIYKSNKLGVDFRSKKRGYQLISQQEMEIGISDRMFKEFKVTKWLRIVPILCPAMLSLSLFRICFWSHPGRTCGSYLRDPLWSTDYFQPPKHYYFHGENDMCFAGWWFQPLWRIWVRQLGWLCPIWKNKTCSKPPNSLQMGLSICNNLCHIQIYGFFWS